MLANKKAFSRASHKNQKPKYPDNRRRGGGERTSSARRRLIAFNKPYRVLCQFKDKDGRKTLGDYLSIPDVYPAGRLDYDSEGLLLLTNDGALQAKITHPKFKLPKTYWVQVEGVATDRQIAQLQSGVVLKDGLTRPAIVRRLSDEPPLWQRTPPIRYRANIPTSWLEITITEGRNRQVRRMTASVDLPTLRLIRVQIGQWRLGRLQTGSWKELSLS